MLPGDRKSHIFMLSSQEPLRNTSRRTTFQLTQWTCTPQVAGNLDQLVWGMLGQREPAYTPGVHGRVSCMHLKLLA